MQSFIYLLANNAAERDAFITLEQRMKHEGDLDVLRRKATETARELSLDIPWLDAFLDGLTTFVKGEAGPLGYTPYNAYVIHIHRLVHGLSPRSTHIFSDTTLPADGRFDAPHLAWVAPLHQQAIQQASDMGLTARAVARWLHHTHGLAISGNPVPYATYKAAQTLYLDEWTCMDFTAFLAWYVANLTEHGEFKADEALV
jgi:hypothetical protein